MNNLTEVILKPFKDSIYIKPLSMHFTLNGLKRTWDMLDAPNSVVIIIHNITKKTLVFVKQFRPAVYYGKVKSEDRKTLIDLNKYPVDLGVTIEFCAGIVDKNLPLSKIAHEEILEECGYNVPVESLERIVSYPAGVGVTGCLQTLYYCEVTDDMKTGPGGGVEDESIEIIEMTIPEIRKYISQPKFNSPPSCLFGIYWFLNHKVQE